ncbi:group XIIA secretory phospholipase A2-like [Acanthaster planci]|uniref:Group XIIA secretory phospholipase A2-like n=1 Tax=Acanthaster planci TaxID=133434 RepID=A0A8B7Y6R9_ACAPL|nr:group XIIA secretory phospholipase A2-like [Acanthaster planci]
MVCLQNSVPFLARLGLYITLISINWWSAVAAGGKNGQSFEQNLKDFSSMAENLAGGLKTVAKAAKILSGDIDLGEAEDCTFVCKNGATPRQKVGYIPEENGCGSYGLKLDLSKLPQMEQCCNKHDRCYGQCGMDRETCDLRFSQCLEKVCKRLGQKMEFNQEESEGCTMTVQLMYLTVLELGCEAYLGSQRQACACQLHHDDNRTGPRRAKRSTRVEL